ncbi:MAG: invasion associated locus B family protein [Alphaproteobacteria bacterium]|nr:invasion associated locus B family protein [Alphaproteobacteria bacterium]MBU2084306.1 invasion associated locus B family protein [Alphaproteobacteria bacterium]MBU2143432.1 invasion associated locus B family protein [Alphaproteobacteria bacterium]MBU2196165.1 invasion associated locus B family protein [Alphaproteobacteria bacterium]
MQYFTTHINRIAILGLFLAIAVPCAMAQPTAIGRYNDWSVFTDTISGETVCYAATPATDKAPASANHGEVWYYVTNWKSGRARNQPSLKVGFKLRESTGAKASVGRSSWSLFSVGQEAFADDSDDKRIIDALKKGSELRVEAVSERNTQVAYHFSLKGSAAAIDKASAICR